MPLKTILLVFGTRPEAVKLCPLIEELRRRSAFRTLMCVTGQHREMLRQVLDIFQLRPDYDLGIMQDGQSLFDITAAVLARLRPVLEAVRPDMVLVQGDTTTAFAAALGSFYLHIPVGHVEAGLRTYDLRRPFPEEFNRRALGIVSALHFAPTDLAAGNLLREGADPAAVFVTGNTVVDAMRYTVRADYTHPELTWAEGHRLVLLTAHRRESWGAPMRAMFRSIRRVLDEHGDVRAVFPVHPNPAVRAAAFDAFDGCENLRLIEPLDLVGCHNFEARCFLCLTDSGGMQEECPAFGRPVLVLRSATERPEGIEAGTARLAGVGEEEVYRAFTELLDDGAAYEKMAKADSPYGDGHAAEKIADILERGAF